jgi:hypothetical protein
MVGAQTIISGVVSKVGPLYRLRMRAIHVESATIQGQFNRNIPDGPTIAALANGSGAYDTGNYGSTGTGGQGGTGAAAAKTPSAQASGGNTASSTPARPERSFDQALWGTWVYYNKGLNNINERVTPNPSTLTLIITGDTFAWESRSGTTPSSNDGLPPQGVTVKGYSRDTGMVNEFAQGLVYISKGGSYKPLFEYLIRTRNQDGKRVLTIFTPRMGLVSTVWEHINYVED